MVARMNETTRRPWIVSAAVLGGLGLAIFVVGAILGYFQGAFGEGGNADQGFDWAVKTGLLLVAMSAFLGIFSGVVLTKLKLPAFIGWALVMGLAFAIMNGGGILLGISDKVFWLETIKGVFFGAIIGAIAGPLIHRIQMRRSQTTQLNSEKLDDQKKT